MRKTHKFSPEVYKIEEEILDYLNNVPMFQSKNLLFIKIFGYFTTRQFLTQENLRKVTGLSSGSISEEIRTLVNDNLIEIHSTSKTGKITYNSGPAGLILLKLTINILKQASKWETPLIELKDDFCKNKENLKDLEGYDDLEHIINMFLPLFSLYKEIQKEFEKVVENFESSDFNRVEL